LNYSQSLFSIGQFDFKLNHLLIIGILSLSFSISFLIRSQPAEWGWELNEFDPFFNYRATEYLLENGLEEYFEWNDELSWYPHGRNVSQSSQVILHLTAATTYSIFGGGNLYDFTILFPAIIGSLTCIVLFALVRVIGGTTAGLISALLFSISLPIIVRGQIGWFKSEPLGIFLGILGIYLFLSGLNSQNHKIGFAKLIGSGIFIIFGLSAWGGNQFFVIPLGIFFFILPFLRNDHKFLICAIPVFTLATLVTSLGFERLGTNFIFGLGGIGLLVPTAFLICCIIIQNKSKKSNKTRNGILFFVVTLIIIASAVSFLSVSELLPLPSFRYLNAINPFLTTTDPLVDSVAEHATTSIQQSFIFHSILMIFAGLGIWLLLNNSKSFNFIKNDMISFSLIIGLLGVYLSSAFVRLEVFGSISVIILSSLGIAILLKYFNSRDMVSNRSKELTIKISFLAGIVILLSLPLADFQKNTIWGFTDNPPTILNGGTSFQITSDDWIHSLEWIKNNTPEDAVIASWWDYGYWIQTKAERASLADNSTLNDQIIKKIAKIFTNNPDQAWKNLTVMDADYFVVFVAARELNVVGADNQKLYLLEGGGEESKKQWFFRIAGEPGTKYLHSDGRSGTDHFWNETFLGKMIPYDLLGYFNIQTNEQSLTYKPGFVAIYERQNKFNDIENSPFNLVYSSPSYENSINGHVLGVFVYEINKDYVPLN